MERGALQAADQVAASLTFTGPSSGTLPLRPSPLPTWRKRKLSKGDAVTPLPEPELDGNRKGFKSQDEIEIIAQPHANLCTALLHNNLNASTL